VSVTETDPLAITRANLSTVLLLLEHLRHHDRVSADGAMGATRAALQDLGGPIAVAVHVPSLHCLPLARHVAGCLVTAAGALLQVKPHQIEGILADAHHALREAIQHHLALLVVIEANDDGDAIAAKAQA